MIYLFEYALPALANIRNNESNASTIHSLNAQRTLSSSTIKREIDLMCLCSVKKLPLLVAALLTTVCGTLAVCR